MEAEKRHTAEQRRKISWFAELVKAQRFRSAGVFSRPPDRSAPGAPACELLAAQGMKMEELKKMDLPRLRAGQREQAIQDVKFFPACWSV